MFCRWPDFGESADKLFRLSLIEHRPYLDDLVLSRLLIQVLHRYLTLTQVGYGMEIIFDELMVKYFHKEPREHIRGRVGLLYPQPILSLFIDECAEVLRILEVADFLWRV